MNRKFNVGPLRRPWVRAGAIALGCALAAGGIVLVGTDNGNQEQQVQLLSGSAWLSSDKVGQLTLLDGSSAEVAGQVQIAPPGDSLKVVQQGSSAYAVDQSAGTIQRVDGATFDMSAPQSPISDVRSGLTVYAGPNVVYALDSQRGVLAAADPKTLERRSDPVPVAEQLSSGTAAMDDAGRLWMIDKGTGDLTSYVDGKRATTDRGLTKPGNSVITVANGRPVVVDVDGRQAMAIDPDTGQADKTFNLELRQGDSVQVSGSPHSAQLYVVASRGVLNICDVDQGTCDHAVPLSADSTFGAPVEAANRLFVPDYKTGQVWIVDLKGAKVITRTNVLDPGGQFQLFNRDGVVFFNDPNSAKAGVLQLDGTLTKAAKYDPDHPDRGVTTPGGTNSQDTGNQQTQNTVAPQPGQQQQQQPSQGQDQQVDHRQSGGQTPPPPANPGNNPPGKTAAAVHITASNANPKAGEEVTLQVNATDGAEIANAAWTYGDGSDTGQTVRHIWQNAQDQPYLITVQVTMKDGRTATDSSPITVHPKSKATLTVTPATGGKVVAEGISCGVDCTETVDEGTRFHLTATADPTYKFTGWASGPCKSSGTNPCDLVIGQDNIGGVSAGFESTLVQLTANVPDGGGAIDLGGNHCTSRCTYSFEAGSAQALAAVKDADHDFAGWDNGCPASAASCTVTATTAKTIVARFTIKLVTLKMSVTQGGKVTGQGINCDGYEAGKECTVTYPIKTGLDLTATPKPPPVLKPGQTSIGRYVFRTWTGACQSFGENQVCHLTLTADQTVASGQFWELG
jgi:List-Bact-rpt repeat protein